MNYSELPKFPPVPLTRVTVMAPPSPRFTERHRRLLLNALISVALVGLMFWMCYLSNLTSTVPQPPPAPVDFDTPTVPPLPPAPVDFDTATGRLYEALFKSQKEVDSLLGLPTQRAVPSSEFPDWEKRAANANRFQGGLPTHRRWDLWVDPRNENRWFAGVFDLREDHAIYFNTSWWSPMRKPLPPKDSATDGPELLPVPKESR